MQSEQVNGVIGYACVDGEEMSARAKDTPQPTYIELSRAGAVAVSVIGGQAGNSDNNKIDSDSEESNNDNLTAGNESE